MSGHARRQWSWIAVVAVLAVVAGLVSWRHLRDDRERVGAGVTISATEAFDARTTASYLLLPDGRLNIRATRPLAGVDNDPAVQAMRPPEDGSFVGIQVERDDTASPTKYGFGRSNVRKTVPTTLTLVADGRRFPLSAVDRFGQKVDADDSTPYGMPFVAQRVYLAIAGKPDRLQLEATFEGRRQRVDLRTGERDTGAFAPLYENRTVEQSCGPGTSTPGFTPAPGPDRPCVVDQVQRTPYYPVFGWAPAGRAWAVVGVRTQRPEGFTYRSGSSVARYESFGPPDFAADLDGVAAKSSGLFSSVFGSSTRRDVALFSAAANGALGRLGVTLAYDNVSLRSDSSDRGVEYDATVTTSFRTRLS